jgi:hypothetical protein
MPKFRVTLTADAYVSTVVTIEAATQEEANLLAVEYAEEGNASWNYQGVQDGTIEVSE